MCIPLSLSLSLDTASEQMPRRLSEIELMEPRPGQLGEMELVEPRRSSSVSVESLEVYRSRSVSSTNSRSSLGKGGKILRGATIL